jgi:thiamine-phosphate pyrophosphorylase
MTDFTDDELRLDPDFAARFERDGRRPPCQLYLISPSALDRSIYGPIEGGVRWRPGGCVPVAAEGASTIDAIAALAPPLPKRYARNMTCAFIVNDSATGWPKRLKCRWRPSRPRTTAIGR